MIAKQVNVIALRTTWIEGFHTSKIRGESPSVGLPEHRPARDGHSGIPKRGGSMKEKKLTLSKETLRTLDEKELSQIVGGDQSGSHTPPQAGPNSCPNTKPHACS
jgi:bacteriocin-like protein